MASSEAWASLRREPTKVPTIGQRQLKVEPGHPWPSAYRGSKYSIFSSRKHGYVVRWSHMGDIQAFVEKPTGLQSELERLGKRDGCGSFRVTASRVVLTKVPAENYDRVDEANANRGHIPVYVGKLSGEFDFSEFSNDPSPPPSTSGVRIWDGLPFDHGETWSVCSDGTLRWRWQDYNFRSAFDHPEVVETYRALRPEGGRIYVNEHGHIWANVDRTSVPDARRDSVESAFREWQEGASNAEKRLVKRRLQRTESDAAPDGLLPVYLGHVPQFDEGIVPKPVVSDNTYFGDTALESDQ
jgi:hypothetical protein